MSICMPGKDPSFNGATALRPWTAAAGAPSGKAPRRSFNGATALRPWTALGGPQYRPAAAYSFNGATALRPWTAAVPAGRPPC